MLKDTVAGLAASMRRRYQGKEAESTIGGVSGRVSAPSKVAAQRPSWVALWLMGGQGNDTRPELALGSYRFYFPRHRVKKMEERWQVPRAWRCEESWTPAPSEKAAPLRRK